MDVMVMENLLYGHNITRLYDLKGSKRSRYNADRSKSKVGRGLNLGSDLILHRCAPA